MSKAIHQLSRFSKATSNDLLVLDQLQPDGNYKTGSLLATNLVSVESSQTEGNKIGSINGVDLYGGNVDNVKVTPLLTEGTKIATISINNQINNIYAPSNLGDGGGVIGGVGGVTDGTLLTQTKVTTSQWKGNQSVAPYKYEYVVQNDCLLNVLYTSNITSSMQDIASVYINDILISWISDAHMDLHRELNLPIKEGTVIKFSTNSVPSENTLPMDPNYCIVIKEFKLTFISTQSSFPEYNCASYVIETGKFNSATGLPATGSATNNSWYRLYSDGWCEQGGLLLTPVVQDTVVKFRYSYKDKSYTHSPETEYDENSGSAWEPYIKNKSTNKMTVHNVSQLGGGMHTSWKTEGYIN